MVSVVTDWFSDDKFMGSLQEYQCL